MKIYLVLLLVVAFPEALLAEDKGVSVQVVNAGTNNDNTADQESSKNDKSSKFIVTVTPAKQSAVSSFSSRNTNPEQAKDSGNKIKCGKSSSFDSLIACENFHTQKSIESTTKGIRTWTGFGAFAAILAFIASGYSIFVLRKTLAESQKSNEIAHSGNRAWVETLSMGKSSYDTRKSIAKFPFKVINFGRSPATEINIEFFVLNTDDIPEDICAFVENSKATCYHRISMLYHSTGIDSGITRNNPAFMSAELKCDFSMTHDDRTSIIVQTKYMSEGIAKVTTVTRRYKAILAADNMVRFEENASAAVFNQG